MTENIKKPSRSERFVQYVCDLCRSDSTASAALRRSDRPALEYQSWGISALILTNHGSVRLLRPSEPLSHKKAPRKMELLQSCVLLRRFMRRTFRLLKDDCAASLPVNQRKSAAKYFILYLCFFEANPPYRSITPDFWMSFCDFTRTPNRSGFAGRRIFIPRRIRNDCRRT